LLTAITEFAKQDKPAFLKFVEQNVDSNLLVVYLLARGLEVASEEATSVLNYLLADPDDSVWVARWVAIAIEKQKS